MFIHISRIGMSIIRVLFEKKKTRQETHQNMTLDCDEKFNWQSEKKLKIYSCCIKLNHAKQIIETEKTKKRVEERHSRTYNKYNISQKRIR